MQRRWIVATVLLVSAAVVVVWLGPWSSHGSVVPDVVGLSLAEANAELQSRGLRVGELEAVRSRSVTGTVLRQSAAGDGIPSTGMVALVLSAGRDPEPGPDGLVGVGGTCDLVPPSAIGEEPCFGGPLMARYVPDGASST